MTEVLALSAVIAVAVAVGILIAGIVVWHIIDRYGGDSGR